MGLLPISEKSKDALNQCETLWLDSRLADFTVTLPPLSSVGEWEKSQVELMAVLGIPEIEMMNKWPIVYRGNGGKSLCDFTRWELLGSDPLKTLSAMQKACRQIVDTKRMPIEIDDRDLAWLMRHAGLISPLLDFSKSFYVALWFAIHNHNGNLRDDDASVWVVRLTEEMDSRTSAETNSFGQALRPHVYNQVQYEENGETMFYRPACQESVAICQRFINDGEQGSPRILPLNKDPYMAGRIVRIPIEGDYAAIEKDIERVLMQENETYGVYRSRDDLVGLQECAFYAELLKAGESCYTQQKVN